MKRAPAPTPELVLHRPIDTRSSTAKTLPNPQSKRWMPFTIVAVAAACLASVIPFVVSHHHAASDGSSPGRLSPFESSRSLQRGDTIVVHRGGESSVQQVAGRANEGVLLKRGSALQGLYMAGKDSYVVISDRDTKIVRAKEIIATVAPPEEGKR